MAIELIAKIKQANNGTFKLVDATDVELKDGSDLQSFLDNINDKIELPENPGTSQCQSNNVVESENEPVNDEVLIWIDTTEGENDYSHTLQDKIIAEFSSIFKNLEEKIIELQKKNTQLEARVLYLEENGSSGSGGGSGSGTPSVDGTIMTFEDGSILVDENGILLAFETVSTTINQTKLTFETGEILVDEENDILILEK